MYKKLNRRLNTMICHCNLSVDGIPRDFNISLMIDFMKAFVTSINIIIQE